MTPIKTNSTPHAVPGTPLGPTLRRPPASPLKKKTVPRRPRPGTARLRRSLLRIRSPLRRLRSPLSHPERENESNQTFPWIRTVHHLTLARVTCFLLIIHRHSRLGWILMLPFPILVPPIAISFLTLFDPVVFVSRTLEHRSFQNVFLWMYSIHRRIFVILGTIVKLDLFDELIYYELLFRHPLFWYHFIFWMANATSLKSIYMFLIINTFAIAF